MKKYSKKLFVEVIISLIIVNCIICFFGKKQISSMSTVAYDIEADQMLTLEMFYSENEVIQPENMQIFQMNSAAETAKFQIPVNTKFFRIDLGMQVSQVELSEFKIMNSGYEISIDITQLQNSIISMQDIEQLDYLDGVLRIQTNGNDPFLLIDLSGWQLKETFQELNNQRTNLEKGIVCLVLDVLVLIIYFAFPATFMTPFEILINWRMIFDLAKNDFKTRYVGSYFGMIWAFIQPVVTVVLYWFVFQIGLGAGPVDGYPFVIWLVSGLIPWMFFQDVVLYGTNSLMEYSYLVKKVVFDVDILPMVKAVSAFFIHVVFLGIAVILFSLMGYFPGIYCFQILYYSLCTAIFAISFAYFTSAVVVFFRDLGQIINILLQIGTWMTPIMWQIGIIPEKFQWVFKLNPMFYVVQGYRDSVLYGTFFLDRLTDTAYFWMITIVLFTIGNGIFQKLKPHFPDVL